MTAVESAFLERICAAPDDDAPRLIFADWLDERGDPRGEFIRVQIALARLPADDPRRAVLADCEAMLLARFHAPWSEPLRGVAGWTEFRRGFVETVNMEARTFLRRADELFRLAPVREVRFLDVGTTLDRLMASPFLSRLSAIAIFAQHIDEKLTRALVHSEHLSNLRALNIGRNRVGDRGAERLAWSPRFQALRELNLSDNAIGDTGVRALAGSANLRALQTLELRRNELSVNGLRVLCNAAELSALRHLGLALNYIGTPKEGSFTPSGKVALHSLDLSENFLGADGIGVLTNLPGLGELHRLVLQGNEIGNAGATALAEWSAAASLRMLLLPGNRIGDEGARALANSPYLFNLLELDLSDNTVHDSGAFEFLNSTSLPRLKRLSLPHLGLTSQLRRAIALRFAG